MSGVRKWKQDCHSVPGQDELQNEHITKNNKDGRKERRGGKRVEVSSYYYFLLSRGRV